MTANRLFLWSAWDEQNICALVLYVLITKHIIIYSQSSITYMHLLIILERECSSIGRKKEKKLCFAINDLADLHSYDPFSRVRRLFEASIVPCSVTHGVKS